MTDDDLGNIIKHQVCSATKKITELYSLSFNEALFYLMLQPYLLRTPIIISSNKLPIGYNADEIRKFIPREYRNIHHKSFEHI